MKITKRWGETPSSRDFLIWAREDSRPTKLESEGTK